MGIYDEFLAKVKSSANTPSLSKFVEALCRKMGVVAMKFDATITNYVKANDPEILTALRDETQLIIMLMREHIQEKKQGGGDIEDGIF